MKFENLTPGVAIAAFICTDSDVTLFNSNSLEKHDVIYLYHDIRHDILFTIDFFEYDRLKLVKNNQNYKFILTFKSFTNEETKTVKNQGLSFINGYIDYFKQNKLKLDNLIYLKKEAAGYLLSDIESLLKQIKEEIETVNTDTFKYYNAVLSKKNLGDFEKSQLIVNDLANHFKNFNIRFFCYRLNNMFGHISAIKLDTINKIQNLIVRNI